MALRRSVLATLFTVVPLAVLAPVPAHADTLASGSVGRVNMRVNGQPIVIPTLAPCAVGGAPVGSTSGALARDFVAFGRGTTDCRRETGSGASTVRVSGEKFRLDGLHRYGGPVIKIVSFYLECRATSTGSQARLSVSGISGLRVPNPIPANYTIMIPNPGPNHWPVAKVVVNEVIAPDPPDGSLTMNLLHIWLFPTGIVNSGDLVVGSVSCSPTDF